MSTVLILGSGPVALQAADWPRAAFTHIVAINNAWRVRGDWTHLIHPEDFPPERRPEKVGAGQTVVTAQDYVPAQNVLGGFVYAGGTMSFTAGYWALQALRPSVIAYFGCDMVYPQTGSTHFYGTGTADPLRPDVTLRSLEAKSCRLRAFAARQGCAMVNLSAEPSRLCLPRETIAGLAVSPPQPAQVDAGQMEDLLSAEQALGYFVPSGRYWEVESQFDPRKIDEIDRGWRALGFAEQIAPENAAQTAA